MAKTLSVNQFTRKLGPLPVYAWALLLLGGYYAYSHFKKSSSTPASTDTSTTGQSSDTGGTGTYVPGFDAASGLGGSAYSTPPTSTITNNYYGDTAGGQAGGGGTGGSGTGDGSGTGGGDPSGPPIVNRPVDPGRPVAPPPANPPGLGIGVPGVPGNPAPPPFHGPPPRVPVPY